MRVGETPKRCRLYTEQGFVEHSRACPQTKARLDSIRAHPRPVTGNYALQDYQIQMMLLEQQNTKRRRMARQELKRQAVWEQAQREGAEEKAHE